MASLKKPKSFSDEWMKKARKIVIPMKYNMVKIIAKKVQNRTDLSNFDFNPCESRVILIGQAVRILKIFIK